MFPRNLIHYTYICQNEELLVWTCWFGRAGYGGLVTAGGYGGLVTAGGQGGLVRAGWLRLVDRASWLRLMCGAGVRVWDVRPCVI